MRNNLQQHSQFLPQVDYSDNIELCYRDSVLVWGSVPFSAGLVYVFIEYLVCARYFSRYFLPIISFNPHGNLKRKIVVSSF